MSDLSQLTDEELEAELNKPFTPVKQAIQAANERKQAPLPPDTSYGMNGFQLGAAGLGQRLMRPVEGVNDLLTSSFGTKDDIAKRNEEKRAKKDVDAQLLNNWEARAGGVAGDIGLAAAFPARAGVQTAAAAVEGALAPMEGDINDSPSSQFPTRVFNGALSGGPTALTNKMVQLGGKGAGALRRSYTDPDAIRQADAARRLGITPTIGDLNPSSVIHSIESSSSNHPSAIQRQIDAYLGHANVQRVVPDGAGGTSRQTLQGERLRREIEAAGNEASKRGSQLWNNLDQHVAQNNLPRVDVSETRNGINQIVNRNMGTPGNLESPALTYLRTANPRDTNNTVNNWVAQLTNTNNNQVSFSQVHDFQSMVGRALARARKEAENTANPNSGLASTAAHDLERLYANVSQDVARWSSQDATANKMHNEARQFWRDVVIPGTSSNSVYKKASRGPVGQNPRGYQESHNLYGDVLRRPDEVERLRPFMSSKGRDLTDTLGATPEAAAILSSPTGNPVARGHGPINAAAALAAGNNTGTWRGALAHIPGFNRMSSSPTAQRVYFGKNLAENTVGGRAAYGAAQVPEQYIEDKAKNTAYDKDRNLRGALIRTLQGQ